jgi:hypothetical protein
MKTATIPSVGLAPDFGDEARRTGDDADADVVLDGLQRKLDAARIRLATNGK